MPRLLFSACSKLSREPPAAYCLVLAQNLVRIRSPIVLALVQNLRLRRFGQLNGVQKQ